MFEKARGQFAVSLWDRNNRTLILGRDRVGICPLYYAERDGWLLWGSEVKALLASGLVEARPDPKGIDHLFTFFCAGTTRTFFEGVKSLPPGHYLQGQGRPGRAEAVLGPRLPRRRRRAAARRPDAAGRRAGGPAPAGGRASAAGRRAGRQLHQRRARLDGRARPEQPAAGRGGPVVHDRPRQGRARRAVARRPRRPRCSGSPLTTVTMDRSRDRRRLPRADRGGRGAGAGHLVRVP